MEQDRNNRKETAETAERHCKKCGEPLARDSRYDECDACRRNRVETGKRILKAVGTAGAALASIALIVAQVVTGKDRE